MRYFILNEAGAPAACDDLTKWSEWFMANFAGHVLDTMLPNGLRVKTGFVGREIGGLNVFWESEVITTTNNIRKTLGRYSSKEESITGHSRAIALAQNMTLEDVVEL